MHNTGSPLTSHSRWRRILACLPPARYRNCSQTRNSLGRAASRWIRGGVGPPEEFIAELLGIGLEGILVSLLNRDRPHAFISEVVEGGTERPEKRDVGRSIRPVYSAIDVLAADEDLPEVALLQ